MNDTVSLEATIIVASFVNKPSYRILLRRSL